MIVIVLVVVQPLASVTFTVMLPAPAPDSTNVVAVVEVVPPVVLELTAKVYGEVPPLAVKVPVPFVSPKQFKAMLPVLVNTNALAG